MTKVQRTVLIVDDAKEDRLMIRRALRQNPTIDYQFLEAETGAQALACLRQQQPDCLLLDYHLPDTNGLHLLHQVVQQAAPHIYPVVMLTGASNASVAVQALQQGAHDFLSKHTFVADQLQRAVNNATEKVALLRQLEEERDWFRLTLASIGEGVITTDTQGCITWLNPVAEAVTGWTSSAAHGQPLAQIFVVQAETTDHPQTDPVTQVLRTNQPVSQANATLLTRRRAIPIDYSAAPIQDRQGKLRGVVLSLRDVSERQAAEHALRTSEELNRLALDAADLGVWRHDLVTDRITFDQRSCAHYGFGEKTVPVSTVLTRIHPDDRERLAQAIQRTLDPQQSRGRYSIEYRVVHPDGAVRWLAVEAQVYFAGNGNARAVVAGVGTSQDITERKQAEAQLRESEARLHLGMTVAGLAIAEVDYTTNLITLSPEAAALYGLPAAPARVPRATVHECFHPDDRPWLLPQIEQVLDPQGDGVMDVEHRILLPDGTVRWLQVRKQVFFTDAAQGERRPLRSLLAAVDITARKTAEAALRASEAKLQVILDNVPAAIYMLSPDHRYLFVNRCFAEGYNQTEAEIVGLSAFDRFPPAVAEVLAANEQRVLATRQAIMVEEAAPRNGQMEYYTTIKAPLLNEAGDPYAIIGISLNITDRKRAEEALRTSEERLRLALTGGGMGIWEWDIPNDRSTWDAQEYALFGLPLGMEITHDRFNALIHPEDFPSVKKAVDHLRDADKEYRNEFRIIRPDGQVRWLAERAIVVRDAHSQPLRMVGINFDITTRKAQEEELRQLNLHLEQRVDERTRQLEQKTIDLERSNKELEKFAYVASHDLRSPLRAIDNLATWIAEDADHLLPDASKAHLAKMRGRVRRMDKLLDDLLAYSRLGRFSYNVEPVDLAQLVQDIVGLLNAPPAFQVTVAENLPSLHAQRIPLELVLRNLISNAIKHHHRADGHVHVTAHNAGQWLAFVISDDGPGIAPQFHDKIFEIFQTLKPRDSVEGSGMGLALVKKAVELVGGAITVESAVGAGTTFRFTWPQA